MTTIKSFTDLQQSKKLAKILMTQEYKELLLKDLSTRLPNSVKGTVPVTITLNSYDMDGFHEDTEKDFDVELISINIDGDIEVMAIDDAMSDTIFYQQQAKPWTIEEFTPYLRPLSSMTEEESIEINSMGFAYWTTMINNDLRSRGPMSLLDAIITHHKMVKLIDWLIAHHFDYRGLIEKGLALEAPEGMYN